MEQPCKFEDKSTWDKKMTYRNHKKNVRLINNIFTNISRKTMTLNVEMTTINTMIYYRRIKIYFVFIHFF